ncbi:MAG: hypothetical protein AB1744_12875 [Candidatus Zixiibacteriota bacterium]
MNRRGGKMKKVIALVTVAAICVAVFSPPAAAVCPDPDKPPPWMMTMRETPQGDDSGWNDVESRGSAGEEQPFRFLCNWFSKYFRVLIVPKRLENNRMLDEPSQFENASADREASSE